MSGATEHDVWTVEQVHGDGDRWVAVGPSRATWDEAVRDVPEAALLRCICAPDNQDECCPQHGRFKTVQEAWDAGREHERAMTAPEIERLVEERDELLDRLGAQDEDCGERPCPCLCHDTSVEDPGPHLPTCAWADEAYEPAASTPDVHARLTDLVDRHFGARPTMPIDALVDVLERELPVLITQTREYALREAVEECESERRACERLIARLPKNAVHATGVLIADVCARRVRALLGEDEENGGADG